METIERIVRTARLAPSRIALCEGEDARVLRAAVRSADEETARVLMVGDRRRIVACADAARVEPSRLNVIDPAESSATWEYAETLYMLRRHKGMTLDGAREAVLTPLCHANMMVRMGHADGIVAGAVHTTSDVVRHAIQIIGLHPSSKLVSSFFLILFREPAQLRSRAFIFADCALVVDPSADELAQIAMAAADNARRLLAEEPRVAMLSFSTNGSAEHAVVTKVVQAARLVKTRCPGLAIDEDVQVDAALVSEIAQRKLPGSAVNGLANVLIFPNLEAGNIGYKLVERLGGAIAVGPILQGLAKPASDLSRGCSEEDIFNVIAVTALGAAVASAPKKAYESTGGDGMTCP
ncbi:MAG: phosphate acetyltransferase [Gammaproteobacteria bacterium]|nr:phosphate acetyltransferase [Gammaproteobacteria bacterium]